VCKLTVLSKGSFDKDENLSGMIIPGIETKRIHTTGQ